MRFGRNRLIVYAFQFYFEKLDSRTHPGRSHESVRADVPRVRQDVQEQIRLHAASERTSQNEHSEATVQCLRLVVSIFCKISLKRIALPLQAIRECRIGGGFVGFVITRLHILNIRFIAMCYLMQIFRCKQPKHSNNSTVDSIPSP